MKRINYFGVVFVVLVCAACIWAQTRISSGDIVYPKNLTDRFVLFTNTGQQFYAQPDNVGITIDRSTSPATIRVAAAGQNKTDKEDYFDVIAGQTTFTTSSTPSGLIQVFKNGVKLRPTVDFTVSGSVVSITPLQGVSTGDIVCVLYQN